MKIGGPIEACTRSTSVRPLRVFPPMKIGGPIEAMYVFISVSLQPLFPPMKIGGPIEAFFIKKARKHWVIIQGQTTKQTEYLCYPLSA